MVLPALNLFTLNAGILILMQSVRLMIFSLNMVDYSMILVSAQGPLVFGFWFRGLGPGLDKNSVVKEFIYIMGKQNLYLHPRTVMRGQRIKPARTFFQLILHLNQLQKTNHLVSFSVLS